MKRKHYLLRTAALFLSALLLVLGGCSQNGGVLDKDEDPYTSNVQEGQDTGPAFTIDCLSEIGKTFNMIKEENPNIDYQNIDIPDASGQCLGQAQDQFLYYFFGTQGGPSLSDLSAAYGDQLRCAGIVSTIGEVYPETIEETPLEQFFSDHNILEYRYMEDGQINWGWIEFSCDGYLVWINTNESGAYSDGYVPADTIKRSYTVVIIDEEISNGNNAIRDEYWNNYSEDSNIAENGASTEIPGYSNASTPEFFNEIGKTLSELKNEYPEGEFIVSLEGFPDSAASCFGEPGAEYTYFFFGGQSGDFEKAMNECEDQLKCAGFITTANILFPDMEDDMSFEDFFSLIGVDDYEYLVGDEAITGEGWLRFMYSGMEVMVNTNEITAGGGWDFTGAEIVKRDAPVSIADPEISNANQDLADAVMFD